MSHPNPHHDPENERVEDSKFAPAKGSPTRFSRNSASFKSKRRHELKEVDRRWNARKAALKNKQK